MKSRRLCLLAVVLLAAAAQLAAAAPALAGPVLHLAIHHGQTNAIPGGDPVSPRAVTITPGSSSQSALEEVDIFATTGSYRLHFGSDTTAELPYNATAAQVQAALEALPSIGSGNVSVSSPAENGQPFFKIAFQGALADTAVPQVTATDGSTRLGIGPEYWFDVENVGDAATSGPITLQVQLPSGLSRNLVRVQTYDPYGGSFSASGWSCPGSPGDQAVTCTLGAAIARHSASYGLALVVDIAPTLAPGTTKTVRATLSGGGSPAAPAAAGCAAGVAACATAPIPIASAPAPFGIFAPSFTPAFTAADEVTPFRQAGGHPDLLIVPIDFNTVPNPVGGGVSDLYFKKAASNIRDLRVDLPPGFLGDPTAVGECTPAQLLNADCPVSSQVGVIHVKSLATPNTPSPAASYDDSVEPVFNMVHPSGVLNDLAFTVEGNAVHIRAELDPTRNYAITTTVSDINETLSTFSSTLVLWGVPADPSHDSERCGKGNGPGLIVTTNTCPAGIPVKPFLTTPFQCGTNEQITLSQYDSWDHPGAFGPDTSHDLGQFSGCDAVQAQFKPSVSVQPTSQQADSPTGLTFTATVPQNDAPSGVATPPVKQIQVTLPQGVSLNPAFANGLAACSPSQIGLGTNDPVSCPDASKIGTVSLVSPLLPQPLAGTVYLAQQSQNPFGTLLAMYVVVHDTEDRGVLIKVPGRIDLDPATGRVTTTFDEMPQLPFSSLTVSLPGTDRGPLVNPPTCGIKAEGAQFSSWSAPDAPVALSDSFTITQGPGGSPCAPDPASEPFTPALTAGLADPTAGGSSAFTFELTRSDGEQNIGSLATTLPPGLVAKLAGVPLCPDAQAATGDCPAGSQIGTVTVGAGSGPDPVYVPQPGRDPTAAYLAGPYKGAPYSLVIRVPAQAGPFDLGVVTVRNAIYVDPTTAQVTVVSDPLPQIIQGIPTEYRDIRVTIDRPGFMQAPTSCDPMRLTATVTGAPLGGPISVNDQGVGYATATGQTALLSDRFQVGGCAKLPFAPRLQFALSGKGQTGSGDHPVLTAVFTAGYSNEANVHSIRVSLPLSLALDPNNSQHVCTYTVAAAVHGGPVGCPASTIIGTATAITPLLDHPLAANVYLVQGLRCASGQVSEQGTCANGQRPIRTLPSLLVALRGPDRIAIDLRAQSSVNGIQQLVTTFPNVPDAFVQRFTLTVNGGPRGILVITGRGRTICGSPQIANADLVAQSGKVEDLNPKLTTPCGTPARLRVLSHKVKGRSLIVRVVTSERGRLTLTGRGLHGFSRVLAAGVHQIRIGLTRAVHARAVQVQAVLEPANAQGATHTFTIRE